MKLERKYRMIRKIAVCTVAAMVWQVIFPPVAYALTSGPTAPEVQSFTPVSSSDMVDLFTGDFQYNIPLFELPGPNGSYPFNLGYQSGVTMDQEASWVGLAWNLNPGAITRQMRGLPDEFKGDVVSTEMDMRPDVTIGVSGQTSGAIEIFGNSNVANTGLNLSLYYNNNRGFGYSIGANTSFARIVDLGFSLDSQEGVGFNAGIGIQNKIDKGHERYSLGVGYNSRRGLTDISLGYSGNKSKAKNKNKTKNYSSSRNIASITPGASAFMPLLDIEKVNRNFSFSLHLGESDAGFFKHGTIGANYSVEKLKETSRSQAAYGYLGLEESSEEDLIDVNRYNDGAVRKNTPNLASSILTHDLYSLSGQGIGGGFRAFRNDHGVTFNPEVISSGITFTGGLDVGKDQFGVNALFGTNQSIAGAWTEDNDLRPGRALNLTNLDAGFHNGKDAALTPDFEKYYFKLQGEYGNDPVTDLDHLLGDNPVRIQLKGATDFPRVRYPADDKLEDYFGNSIDAKQNSDLNREARVTSLQAIKNKQLGSGAAEALSSFQVEHYSLPSNLSGEFSPLDESLVTYSRTGPDHHFAGWVATRQDGMRYTYALPVKNKKEVEAQFSVEAQGSSCGPLVDIAGNNLPRNGFQEENYKVSNTDKFLKTQELPEYAHSYMLTSVLGADYVDADDIPGPSDGDFGFWVKFNYAKVDQDYKWRAPFLGANYAKGSYWDAEDDKGSLMYGERESWYLASAETKTHIAEFHLGKRLDSYGAGYELQNPGDTGIHGTPQFKLNRISLYSKAEKASQGANADPIQEVHFNYSYRLCSNVPNNIHYNPALGWRPETANSGKLTLEEVWTTNESNNRGAKNKYKFNYGNDDAVDNPHYQTHGQDRWGTFRPEVSSCSYVNAPWSLQPANQSERETLDEYAGAWNLKQIELPSGGVMSIEYEADDYGYVQNKRAAEMREITGFYTEGLDKVFDNSSYDPNSLSDRRVYFKLKSAVNNAQEVYEYVKGLDQVYVKIKTNLKKTTDDLLQEYVSGYLKLEKDANGVPLYGIAPNTSNTVGYVVLAKPEKTAWENYHPFALMSWQALRANFPKAAVTPSMQTNNVTAGMSNSAVKANARALLSVANEIVTIFSGFYGHAKSEEWARKVQLDQAWIRLNSPDQIKLGGGSRVKKITIDDKWPDMSDPGNEDNITGVVYDYTMIENDREISSGVAQYEPMTGGDENPFRTAKTYTENTPLKSDNNLFFELPVNEALYPSPIVGYQKVTVKSLATEAAVQNASSGSDIPSTGAAVHEFYTARDFPTIAKETGIERRPFNLPIPLPFIGMINHHDMTASQGYSITLNDMHGKQKKVSNYGQDQDGNMLWDNPLSWVAYNYQFDTDVYQDTDGQIKGRFALKNQVPVILNDVDPNDPTKVLTSDKIIGQDHDFYMDMREVDIRSTSVGLETNVIILGLIIPFPWPSFNQNYSTTRLASTNKVIYRYGIQTGMTAYNEGSYVYTEHKLWDELTGQPLLTTVTNDYDDPVYQYNMPARWAYDRMGAAYQNEGFSFEDSWTQVGTSAYYNGSVAPAYADYLVPGDELLMVGSSGAAAHAVYIGKNAAGNMQIYTEATVPAGTLDCSVVRSGRRNLLGAMAQQVVALKDPTQNRDLLTCYKDFDAPGDVISSISSTTTTVTEESWCVDNLIELLDLVVRNNGVGQRIYMTDQPYATFAHNSCTDFPYVEVWGDHLYLKTCNLQFVTSNDQLVPMANVFAIANPVSQAPGFTVTASSYSSCDIKVEMGIAGSPTPVEAWIHSDCGCPWAPTQTTTTVTNLTSTLTDLTRTHTVENDMYLIDDVLSASATTYSDSWMQDWHTVRFEGANAAANLAALSARHSYLTGEMGIWRGKDSYIYVEEREQTTGTPQLSTDGTWDKMPLFNHNSLIMDYCAENWRRVNEVTAYSPYSYETENRDVLDIRSAALYGYNGKLAVAVAANAAEGEIAFESFEEYDPQAQYDAFSVPTGNWEIYNSYNNNDPDGSFQRLEVWNGNGNSVQTVEAFPGNLPANLSVKTEARCDGDVWDPTTAGEERAERSAGTNVLSSASGNSGSLVGEPYFHDKASGQLWRGYLGVPENYLSPSIHSGFALSLNGVDFSDDKAHTGKQSLKLSNSVIIPQNRLQPVAGKPYALQAWVSRADTDVPFYQQNLPNPEDRIGIRIYFRDASGTLLGSSDLMEPSGRVVEGWQKIEGEFYAPPQTVKLELGLQCGKENGANVAAYFDDLRLQPQKSKMSTYVYNLDDYRLKAVLDDDNFATLYHYDEAGNLYLVQKETYEGLRTLQETRAFMPVQP